MVAALDCSLAATFVRSCGFISIARAVDCQLVVNDLVRARLHYVSAWAFTLFASPVFRHDARLSIRKGFTLDGLRGLLREGGFDDFVLRRCFFYRFLLVLSGEC